MPNKHKQIATFEAPVASDLRIGLGHTLSNPALKAAPVASCCEISFPQPVPRLRENGAEFRDHIPTIKQELS